MPKNQISLTPLWVFLILNFLLSVTALTLHFTTSSKDDIVYVDAIKLISKYKGMDDAKKQFNRKNDALKLNLDTLKNELQQVISNYEKTKTKSSLKERQLTEQLIGAKQKQYYEYEQIVTQQYQKQEQELSAQVLKEVNDYIKKYGERKGYDIIFAATHTGNIAYGKKSFDVTEEVLAGLNSEYKPK